jgi:hypothetical protein
MPEQADQLARMIGRTVSTVDVSPAAAREGLLSTGLPPEATDAIVIGSAWARAGHNAVLTEDVAKVLGRPPTDFCDWAQRHRAAFSSPGTRHGL